MGGRTFVAERAVARVDACLPHYRPRVCWITTPRRLPSFTRYRHLCLRDSAPTSQATPRFGVNASKPSPYCCAPVVCTGDTWTDTNAGAPMDSKAEGD